ncbi:uncharacterized protein LOC131876999 [Tigriopus californicus]|uniref:uncharacterized protein LOC131876999 n=1 Tax=Tigriopus californicus TaxID=6832 RepID=UPI0027DA8720|nr:uncharacterized protein LOC131876999 [Tigriopus californicus]
MLRWAIGLRCPGGTTPNRNWSGLTLAAATSVAPSPWSRLWPSELSPGCSCSASPSQSGLAYQRHPLLTVLGPAPSPPYPPYPPYPPAGWTAFLARQQFPRWSSSLKKEQNPHHRLHHVEVSVWPQPEVAPSPPPPPPPTSTRGDVRPGQDFQANRPSTIRAITDNQKVQQVQRIDKVFKVQRVSEAQAVVKRQNRDPSDLTWRVRLTTSWRLDHCDRLNLKRITPFYWISRGRFDYGCDCPLVPPTQFRVRGMSTQSNRTLGNGVHGSPPPTHLADDRLGLLALSKTFNRFYYGGFQTKECRPLLCQNTQIGLIRKDVYEELRRFEDVFDFSRDDRVSIRDDLDSFESRTQAVDGVLRKIRDDCDFAALRGWRDETYDIRPNFSQEPLLKMERAATCMLGLRQYGIDINGYVNHSVEGLCLWLQKRSSRKPTWPGMWDNFVSGGLSTGFGIAETAVKEAQEEANVSPVLAKTMKPGGVVTFFFESERGIFPQTEFVFDLELPEDFSPENNDGEVEGFELVPVHRIFERLLSPEMKTTSCPVTIDFLVRRGIINSENEPNLPQLVENLHIPIHSCYQ